MAIDTTLSTRRCRVPGCRCSVTIPVRESSVRFKSLGRVYQQSIYFVQVQVHRLRHDPAVSALELTVMQLQRTFDSEMLVYCACFACCENRLIACSYCKSFVDVEVEACEDFSKIFVPQFLHGNCGGLPEYLAV
jgi:hypothetical protein